MIVTKQLNKIILLFLGLFVILFSFKVTAQKHTCDFTNKQEYPVDKQIIDNDNWESIKNGEYLKNSSKGLLLPSESAWSSIKNTNAVLVQKEGDAATVSITLTYDQLKKKRDQELLRIGFTNGESNLMAVFNRKGWGDFNAIGMENYINGKVFHTRKIGFKENTSVGTSDLLQFTMTLTYAKNNTWDMVVSLKNLITNTNFKKHYRNANIQWRKTELTFEKGNSDTLYAVIQNGNSDAEVGVANRLITNFEVSNAPAPAPTKNKWAGVNFKDYILPMEPQAKLVSEGTWGKSILPRDTSNGLEDTQLKNWCYWDGSIVKDDEGKYHMYASCWDQKFAHGPGWKLNSKGMHAVSDHVMGPYKHLGLTWPHWKNGKGHNVIGLRMFDGRVALVTSEVTKGEVFVSDSFDGPFTLLGKIKWDANGFGPNLAAYKKGTGNMSNVMIIPRHDGRYMIMGRSTAVMISDNGILGPYKIMNDKVYANTPEVPQSRMEDPTVWYSGGMYHMLVNHWPGKTTYHFSSKGGIYNWKYRGIAYRKDENIFRYTDGTVDEWKIVQRPTAYTENGHITHFNFSVIDITKGSDKGNDKHGSKIIVVPFDGEAFDRDMQKINAQEENKK